jgi:hypothetical protein
VTTAAQRLVALSGLPSGTAAAHLMARATSPGNAGQRLVAISGLAIGTAAAHLLAIGQLATTPLPSAEIAASAYSTVIQAQAEGGAQAEAQADVIRLEASSDDAKLTTDAKVAQLVASPAEAKLFAAYQTISINFFAGQQLLKSADRQESVAVTDALSRGVGKSSAEQLSVTDALSLDVSKQAAHSVTVGSNGFLILQGYCDITYFASDYVGQSRAFT